MIGLDTNVVLRYLLQDDVKQTRRANQIVDRELSEQTQGPLVWLRYSKLFGSCAAS
jgi:predicted nucleic-acid-binding protein